MSPDAQSEDTHEVSGSESVGEMEKMVKGLLKGSSHQYCAARYVIVCTLYMLCVCVCGVLGERG